MPDGTPDWLKEDNNSPFGNEDVFSNEVTSSSETHQPDWLQDSATTSVVPPPSEKVQISTPTVQEVPAEEPVVPREETVVTTDSADIPDWLQGAPSPEETHPVDSTPKFKALGEETIDILPSAPTVLTVGEDIAIPHDDETMPETVDASEDISTQEALQNDEDIPDWLR